MKKYEKTNAITLIALVVTIIILLILAGVTIMSLTGENGLINKITIARKKQLESETEEKLKLKIMELQTEIIQKEGRQAVLEDLNYWTNAESNYYDSEITNVTDNQENTNKLVEIDGYVFEVDENLNIVGIIEVDVTSKTETIYQINSIDGDVMQVTIKIKNASGIEKVIIPEGKEITPQTNKEEIAIDYEVTSGNNYIFRVKVVGSDEIKEYVLKSDVNAKPEIKQNESYAYPILKENGVEINKTVEIDFGENTNNYYSIDNGKTWNKYVGVFEIQRETFIVAKSIIKGEITRVDSKEITFGLAEDAIGIEAYNEDYSDFFQAEYASTMYMDISNEVWNEPFHFVSDVNGYNQVWFLDESGNTLHFSGAFGIDYTYPIPENTVKIKVYANQSKIYKVGIKNEPVVNLVKQYPDLSREIIEKVQAYNLVEIEYFHASVKRIYKIDDNEWNEYNGEIIRLEEGQTIYAKGVDKYNKETQITTYTSTIPTNAVEFEAYDGKDDTFDQAEYAETLYLEVSSDVWNKQLKFISNGYTGVWFLNESGNTLYFSGYFNADNTFTIPENTTKMKIYSNAGRIYEMSIIE